MAKGCPPTKLGLRPESRLALEALAISLGCSMTESIERLLALPHAELVAVALHGSLNLVDRAHAEGRGGMSDEPSCARERIAKLEAALAERDKRIVELESQLERQTPSALEELPEFPLLLRALLGPA